ncbi:baculoviral IAP repeat-containing protein 5 [Belonocnema kinseyi]|uniref:baculoviral IAP repeat-containing protein 5 n=1 Tax=Belonocnema kinseyi TaxID=2817044 RepID=UPI00143DA3DD|nr:baculoviral IAP repeat-containing protein 5 [Belonocnema kinseyi]
MDRLNDLLAKAKPTFWKKGRLETFENWPFQSGDNECNPERMAAAGFYCVGSKEEPDLVECFICSKQLDGWDPDDDPWSEHEKHQPSCAFVNLNKQEEASWTLDDLYHLLLETAKKSLERDANQSINKVKEHMKISVTQIPGICKAVRRSQKNPS